MLHKQQQICTSVYFFMNISFMLNDFNTVVLSYNKLYPYFSIYFILRLSANQRLYPIL